MKCFAWHKKALYMLGILFLSFILAGGKDITVRAEEKAAGKLSGGILQNGDFLEEKKSSDITNARPRGNIQGAKQAFISALDQVESEVNLYGYQITVDELKNIISDIINNNPKYFYYTGCKYWYYTSTKIVENVSFQYTEDAASIREKKVLYESTVLDILGTVEPSWSDLEKALYVNDYLATNCEYDNKLEKYSSYNVFVDKTAVCQGYALAYQELMNRLNIPCQVVTSEPLNHAWNLVKIGGNWYHVDVTWNDPIRDWLGRARHYYFMKSTDWFQTAEAGNHISKSGETQYVYSGNATDATAANKAYDGYFWNSIDSVFGYYGGYWYANKEGVLYRHKFNNSGLIESAEYKKLNQRWPVFGGSGWWQGNYDGCVVYGNKLYYASYSDIQFLDLRDSSVPAKTAYTPSAAELNSGYIYGFHIDVDGMLRYGISKDPNTAATVYSKSLHTHTYGTWVVTKVADCEERGERAQTCSGCGRKRMEVIPATGHRPGQAATCTTSQICTVCKKTLVPALGHKPGKAATCTEAQTCTVCKKTLAAALGHKPGKAATCTEAQTCTVCKKTLASALGHKPGKAATCTEAQTCTVCKKTLAAALGHKPGKAATCTKAQTCTVCNAVIKKATGHIHKKTTTQASTFTKNGKRTVTCKDCGKVLESRKLAKIKCQKGQIYKVGSYKYKIISNKTNGKGTVSFAGLAKNVKKVKVYDTVKIHGSNFKIVKVEDKALKNKAAVTSVTVGKNVTSIGKEAFSGAKKLKTITIKSTKITKVGAKAFKNIHSKAKIKVPKSKLKKYKALMKNKGQKKTVKIC